MTEPVTDVATLFARDPEGLTREDIDAIIMTLRAGMRNFKSGDVTAGRTTKKKLTKEEQIVKDSGLKVDIDLGDL